MRTPTFETILVPVDFSEISAHALRTASLLAARCGRAKIIAMYANWFEAPPYFTVGRLAELQAEFSESLHLAEHSLEAFVRSTLGDNADSVEVRAMEALPGDAKLTVLHVDEASGTKPISDLCSWVPAEERDRCVIRELVRHGGSLGPAEEIVKLATEEPYDLVVLGAARRRFFEGMVLGPTTLRTVRHAPCPVLTVGSGAEMWETSQDGR
jgi:nucleotide-binding universal stress UspA family protein